MKKLVLKVDINDEKVKNKAMKLVSTILGVETIAMDMNEKKLTVTGDVDPVAVVCKLRKVCHAKILTIGTVKEPEKKDKSKKDEPVNSYETVEGGMGITTVFQFMKGLWNKNDPNKDEPKKAVASKKSATPRCVFCMYVTSVVRMSAIWKSYDSFIKTLW
ncbi:heavy metal-associated isoprenylated plant protein 39-like [Camellia sinensis]|uniref:heavy metal-associated isoprenylated plant protein 39-like n=1 Tax=Camellia sinensis TaxID=4442 RepID=UPI001035D596|nr:heavy metal-associated isoprenylated plant protein 39-like [Camellia sinensis]